VVNYQGWSEMQGHVRDRENKIRSLKIRS
jgi:hypothetical protein